MDDIREFLRHFCATIATAKMYPVTHPMVKDVLTNAFEVLEAVLKSQEELIIGIIEDEIVFEKEVLFDVNAMLELIIVNTKKKGIEKIHFRRNIKKDELIKFISFLITSEEETLGNVSDHLRLLGIKEIRVSSLTTPEGEQQKKIISKLQLYVDFVKSLPEHFKILLSQEKLPTNKYLELKFAVFNIMDNLLGRYLEFLYRDSTEYKDKVFTHSLNVSLLSMFFASKMGFKHDDVLDIGVAALFHDVGRLYIAQGRGPILEKEVRDKYLLTRHSFIGAEILLVHENVVGPLPVVVAFEHHLRCHDRQDNTMAFAQKNHIASSLIAICDFYDSINQRRTPARDYSPKWIYELMKKNKHTFHQKLLDKFFYYMGVWPVGTIVSLSDGRVAVVREENEGDIFSPKVEVISSKDDEDKFVDLSERKEELTIKDAFNPLGEGKQYLHLI